MPPEPFGIVKRSSPTAAAIKTRRATSPLASRVGVVVVVVVVVVDAHGCVSVVSLRDVLIVVVCAEESISTTTTTTAAAATTTNSNNNNELV